MQAEIAYFFRHALQRDAAYQVQTPGERAAIHGTAFHAMVAVFEGPAPDIYRDEWGDFQTQPHKIDAIAADLARHAKEVRLEAQDSTDVAEFRQFELLYAFRAATYAEREFLPKESAALWQTVAELATGVLNAQALIHAAAQERQGSSSEVAEDLVQQALAIELLGQDGKAVRAKALTELASICHRTGRVEEAKAAYAEVIEFYQSTGNEIRLTAALGGLAAVQYYNGNTTEAEALIARSLIIQRELGDRRGEGQSLGVLANLLKNTGRVEVAEETYKRVIQINLDIKNPVGESAALMNLGCLQMDTGRLLEAETAMKEALAIDRKCGNMAGEGAVLTNLATVYSSSNRPELAEEWYGYALEILRETGHRRFEGVALGNLALIFQKTGRLAEAEEYFQRALAIHRAIDFRRFEGLVLCNYSRLKLVQGLVDEARQLWSDGAAILRDLGDTLALNRKKKDMISNCEDAGIKPFETA